MPFCNNIDLTIDMDKGPKHIKLDRLFFHLEISGGVIDSGASTMTISNGSQTTPVSGSCQSVASPDVSVMNMMFTWGAVEVFMIGFVHRDDNDLRIKFLGRFIAFKPIH